jgi:hypothetical protein
MMDHCYMPVNTGTLWFRGYNGHLDKNIHFDRTLFDSNCKFRQRNTCCNYYNWFQSQILQSNLNIKNRDHNLVAGINKKDLVNLHWECICHYYYSSYCHKSLHCINSSLNKIHFHMNRQNRRYMHLGCCIYIPHIEYCSYYNLHHRNHSHNLQPL